MLGELDAQRCELNQRIVSGRKRCAAGVLGVGVTGVLAAGGVLRSSALLGSIGGAVVAAAVRSCCGTLLTRISSVCWANELP